jgi:hypothetical protein
MDHSPHAGWPVIGMLTWLEADGARLAPARHICAGSTASAGRRIIAPVLDCREVERDGRPCVEFSWEGRPRPYGNPDSATG